MNQTDTGCGNCGKQISDHKAGIHHCPGGRKHQTHGYPWFHWSQTFANGGQDKVDLVLRDQTHPDIAACPVCGSDCNERDELIKAEREIERLRAVQKADEPRTVLRELVALADMKARLESLHTMGHGTDWDSHHKRTTAAWAAARALACGA